MKRTLLVVGTVALVAASGAARAQDGAPSSSAEDQVALREAKTRFDEGLKRYAAHDYEGAWAAFTQAYSVLKSADVLWNLCMAELRSGRPLESVRHIRVYLRDPRTTDADRERAKKYLAEASQRTGHVVIDAPPGSKIVVDGAAVDPQSSQEPVDVSSGKHKVECKQGSVEQGVEVDLVPGQTVSVRFLAAAEGQAPSTPTVVTLSREGERPPAPADSGTTTRGPSVKTWLGFGLAGGALVAAGTGIGFLVASGGAKDDASRLRASLSDPVSGCYQSTSQVCSELKDKVDSQVTFKNVSTGAFIAAGALTLGSAAVFILWPEHKNKIEESGRIGIVPHVGPSGASATVEGVF